MADREIRVLASRDARSIVDGWTEYLCLTREADGSSRLFIGGYEFLADQEDYYDEETEDYILPDEINGQKVRGIDCGAVVGGELTWVDHDHTIVFQTGTEPEVMAWLTLHDWIPALDGKAVADLIKPLKT